MHKSTPNDSGQNSEAIVDCVMVILRKKGYAPVSQYVIPAGQLLTKPLCSEAIRVDVLIRGIPGYESGLILSIKRQDSQGTTQEKLYYHIHYLIKKVYPYPTMLLLTGDKWSDELIHDAIRSRDSVLIEVFLSYEELLKWAERIPAINHGLATKGYTRDLPLFGPETKEATQ